MSEVPAGSWVWEVARVMVGSRAKADDEKLSRLLAEGWEPFAVTPADSTFTYVYHFRRQVPLA
jgi:hypothetical protein